MNDYATWDEFAAYAAEQIKSLWQAIYTGVVVPLRRWFNSIDWTGLSRNVRRIARKLGARRPRPRNTRVQMVQAQRARLSLPMDGKLPGLSRKVSYARAAKCVVL